MATIAPLPISFNPSDFSSDFLLNAVGNYNGLSATDRSQYSDDLSFEPLQVDAASFDSTMANPGFLNFITGRKAKGATIFVDEAAKERARQRNVPSISELQRRLSERTPLFYEGEDLPQYDPASGLTPQQFWSQYPSLLQGITTKEAIYGRTPTSVEKEEIEASENVSQSYQQRTTPFSPGGHPGPSGSYSSSIDTPSYVGNFTDIISQIAENALKGNFRAEDITGFVDPVTGVVTRDKAITDMMSQYGQVDLPGPYGGFANAPGTPDAPASSMPAGTTSMGSPGDSGPASGPTAGPGQASSVSPWCWVARKVYGEDNPKWKLFRAWLFTQAPKWLYKAYGKYGERFAEWLDGKPVLQKIIRKWMDKRIQKYLDTQPKTAQEIGPL